MRYAMLIYADEKRWNALPKEAQDRVHAECGAWNEALVKEGRTPQGVALKPSTTAATLRKRDGRVVVTDGPFCETKEVLGGMATFECKDQDEAIAIARRFPALDAGLSVEVRLAIGDCAKGE